jgi:hypothetical protein
MESAKKSSQAPQQSSSIADELTKIAKLKADGVISEAEFQTLRQELIKKL